MGCVKAAGRVREASVAYMWRLWFLLHGVSHPVSVSLLPPVVAVAVTVKLCFVITELT